MSGSVGALGERSPKATRPDYRTLRPRLRDLGLLAPPRGLSTRLARRARAGDPDRRDRPADRPRPVVHRSPRRVAAPAVPPRRVRLPGGRLDQGPLPKVVHGLVPDPRVPPRGRPRLVHGARPRPGTAIIRND